MEIYERECWYCGSRNMESKGDYYQCRSCGATWNEIRGLGPDPLADHGYYIKDTEGNIMVHAGRARPIKKPRTRAK